MPAKSALTPASQLASFIAKFDAPTAKRIKDCRKIMRARLPTANELVYDNYNFFVIGYSPTERPSDSVFSIAAGANGVGLAILHGATLKDPDGILEGQGVQNRFIRLPTAARLKDPAVERIIAAAITQAKVPFPQTGKGQLIIRSISKKQRPRRKAEK